MMFIQAATRGDDVVFFGLTATSLILALLGTVLSILWIMVPFILMGIGKNTKRGQRRSAAGSDPRTPAHRV